MENNKKAKKGLIESFFAGINDNTHGERYSTIMRYFAPELVTNLLLYSLPIFVDNYLISRYCLTTAYATAGVTSTLLHWFIKIADAFPVGMIIVVGQFNGAGDYAKAGKAFKNIFWSTVIIGICIAGMLYGGASIAFYLMNVPHDVQQMGVSYLQLRSIGLLITFIYFAYVGFLRAVKNTKTPMVIYILGSLLFVLCDYTFILGWGPIPSFGLNGSAMAFVVQYSFMALLSAVYIFTSPTTKRYAIDLFRGNTDLSYVKTFFAVSWPVMIDKATLAFAYVWFCTKLAPMGTMVLAAFNVIRDLERFSFLPGLAIASVITFLVSNDIGARRLSGVKSNIKKSIFLSGCMMFSILIVFSLIPKFVISIFDKRGDFTIFAAHVFPVISILLVLDLLQLILAGALRGAGQVRVVMLTRLVFLCYFLPLASWLSHVSWRADIKFIAIYSAFYIGNGFMSIFYIYWFRSGKWRKQIEVQDD